MGYNARGGDLLRNIVGIALCCILLCASACFAAFDITPEKLRDALRKVAEEQSFEVGAVERGKAENGMEMFSMRAGDHVSVWGPLDAATGQAAGIIVELRVAHADEQAAIAAATDAYASCSALVAGLFTESAQEAKQVEAFLDACFDESEVGKVLERSQQFKYFRIGMWLDWRNDAMRFVTELAPVR